MGFTPILAASSVPYYLLGWILIWFLAFQWRLFPLQGGWDNFNPLLAPGWNIPFILSAIHHSILPALSVIIATAGFWTVTMRGLMVNMQGEDFMIFAAAKGLSGQTAVACAGYSASSTTDIDAPSPTGAGSNENGSTPSRQATLKPNCVGSLRR